MRNVLQDLLDRKMYYVQLT